MGFVSNSEPSPAASARGPIIRAVLIGGLIGAILSVLSLETGGRAVFDTWQRQSPREIGTDNVAVVLVDDVSVESEGAWPWSRYLVARLIENIALAEPAAVGAPAGRPGREPTRRPPPGS